MNELGKSDCLKIAFGGVSSPPPPLCSSEGFFSESLQRPAQCQKLPIMGSPYIHSAHNPAIINPSQGLESEKQAGLIGVKSGGGSWG